jgi:hypothetical protein
VINKPSIKGWGAKILIGNYLSMMSEYLSEKGAKGDQNVEFSKKTA